MSSLLTIISDLEKELNLLDNIVQNILIYNMKTNKLVVNFKFNISEQYDTNLIGGLTATINEFAGAPPLQSVRTIVLKQLKLIFIAELNFLIVFATNPEYPDSQFKQAIITFANCFSLCYDKGDEFEDADNAAIAIQIIHGLISDGVDVEFLIDPSVKMFPFKIREIADERSSTLIGMKLYTPVIDLEKVEDDSEIMTKQQGMYNILNRFTETFGDVQQITLIQFTDEGSINKFSSGKLDAKIDAKVYETVLGMMENIVSLLDKNLTMRTLDLEGNWLYLHYVDERSFLYVIIDNKDILKLILPLVERITVTICNLFPN